MAHQRFTATLVAIALAFLASVSGVAAEQTLVDLNTASVAQLNELNGIGDAKANAIVQYREKNGPFQSVDDLRNVSGIGDKLLARLRPQLTVGNQANAPAGKTSKQ
jgi:competence protein ComEA